MYRNYTITIPHLEGATLHAPDLSVHTQRLLDRLTSEYGFDAIPVFCGDQSIYKALHSPR